MCKTKYCWAFYKLAVTSHQNQKCRTYPKIQSQLALDSDWSSTVETHIKRLKDTSKFQPETYSKYMCSLYCIESTNQTVNELNIHHTAISEKHSSWCFHSTIQSAISKNKNSQPERNDQRLTVDKTRAEWIWDRLMIYIIFEPSEMKNGEKCLWSWTTDGNRSIRNAIVWTGQNTLLSVRKKLTLELRHFPMSENQQWIIITSRCRIYWIHVKSFFWCLSSKQLIASALRQFSSSQMDSWTVTEDITAHTRIICCIWIQGYRQFPMSTSI